MYIDLNITKTHNNNNNNGNNYVSHYNNNKQHKKQSKKLKTTIKTAYCNTRHSISLLRYNDCDYHRKLVTKGQRKIQFNYFFSQKFTILRNNS